MHFSITHNGNPVCDVPSIDDVAAYRAQGLIPQGSVVTPVYSQGDFDIAIRKHMEAVARGRDFEDAFDATTFTQSAKPEWAVESVAFIAWRDAVWIAFDAAKANLPATPELFIASLPAIVWSA